MLFCSLSLCLFFVEELCFCHLLSLEWCFINIFWSDLCTKFVCVLWKEDNSLQRHSAEKQSLYLCGLDLIHTWRRVLAYVWWQHVALLLYTRYDLNEINCETALKHYCVYQRYGLPFEAQLYTLSEWMSLYFVNSDCRVLLHYFVQYLCIRYSF